MDSVVIRAIHKAALECEPEIAMALLTSGLGGEVDCLTSTGLTPLMLAALQGCMSVAKVLLSQGANINIATEDGITALLLAAVNGQHAMAELLMKAGADLEIEAFKGGRALLLAAHLGDVAMMRMLIKAGANVDARKKDGATALFAAAKEGHLGAIRLLLRANANPQLSTSPERSGASFVPLDTAAEHGHLGVVRELIETVGVKGCGGEDDGTTALQLAAKEELLDVMALLTDLGVVDWGKALVATSAFALVAPVKFLLEKHAAKFNGRHRRCRYPDVPNQFGATSMIACVEGGSCSPRIMRLLIDAGGDTKSRVRVAIPSGEVHSNGTPLDAVLRVLSREKAAVEAVGVAKDARGGVYALEATRRLLLRVDAVHAVSWLWPAAVTGGAARCGVVANSSANADNDASIAIAAEGSLSGTTTKKKEPSLPQLRMMLPLLERRARRRDMLLVAMPQ